MVSGVYPVVSDGTPIASDGTLIASDGTPLLLQYEGPPGSVEDVFCLTFSLEFERFGQRQVVELVHNGDDILVTEDNRLE